MSVNVPVSRLKKACSPYEDSTWESDVTMGEVKSAITEGRLIAPGDSSNLTDHAGRIAYFVKNGWVDPVDIDVGVPVLGHYANWLIQDGNHRFAAAVYLKKRHISASISGQVDYAKKILGVVI